MDIFFACGWICLDDFRSVDRLRRPLLLAVELQAELLDGGIGGVMDGMARSNCLTPTFVLSGGGSKYTVTRYRPMTQGYGPFVSFF